MRGMTRVTATLLEKTIVLFFISITGGTFFELLGFRVLVLTRRCCKEIILYPLPH